MISSSFFICSDSRTSSYLAEIFARSSRSAPKTLCANKLHFFFFPDANHTRSARLSEHFCSPEIIRCSFLLGRRQVSRPLFIGLSYEVISPQYSRYLFGHVDAPAYKRHG